MSWAHAQTTTLKCKGTNILLVASLKKHTSHIKHTVLDIINKFSNHAPLNYSGQESKTKSQFMILIYLWPWNKVKVIKPDKNYYTPSKVIIMQSLKDLP